MWGGRISIIGLQALNKHLFDNLEMPGDLSRERFIKMLCMDAAELEAVYTEPYIMQDLIGQWSSSQMYEWTKLYQLTQLEYNPIYNYDRTEEETIKDTMSGTSSGTGSTSRTTGGTQQNNVTGYNVDSFSPATQQTVSGTESDLSSASSQSSGKNDRERSVRAYGNIGVTSTQQMMQQEMEIARMNIYEIMIKEFINRFCVQVY